MKTMRALLVLTAGALLVSCAAEQPILTTEVVAVERDAVALDPADPAWNDAPEFAGALLLQDLVDPRLMEASTPEVRVRAMTDGRTLAFRLAWADATLDDLPGNARFSDACAVQLAPGGDADLPAPQMGEPGRGVEIAFWRASWQASVDGRPDSIQAFHPRATVDHYPFEAESLKPGSKEQREMESRYAPARAVGNPISIPPTNPVQTLLAEGPGSLRPDPDGRAEGKGLRSEDGWIVVIARPVPPALSSGERGQVAFAVWEGSHEEVGARKMRTGWVALLRKGES